MFLLNYERGLILALLIAAPLLLHTDVLVLPALCIFLYFLVAPVKTLIKTNHTNSQKLTELKKWKADAGLFTTLWRQEKAVDNTIWPNDLVIGNPNAPLLITVACNPNCGPCAKAHKQLDDLLHRFAGKVKVQVRLLCNAADKTDKTDKLTKAVKAILQRAATVKNNAELQQMLTDWFEWMDFERWNVKYSQKSTAHSSIFPPPLEEIEEVLVQHSKWVEESGIQFTPTFFINGHKLPGRYNLNDLEMLLPQLAETLTEKMN